MSEASRLDAAESLLSLFHLCPVGLLACDDRGDIALANPAAVNLLMPALGVVPLENVLDLFLPHWPELADVISGDGARLVENHRIGFGASSRRSHLSFNLVRFGTDHLLLTLADVTDVVGAEEERSRLLELERAARFRTELLERTATHLAAATTVDDLAHTLLQDVSVTLGADIATINLLEDDGIRILLSSATQSEAERLGPKVMSRYLRGEIGHRMPGAEAIRTNAIIQLDTTDEIREQFPFVVESLSRYPLESLIASPLRAADGSVLGALVIGSPLPNWLDKRMLGLIQGISDQAGSALERALLFDEVSRARDMEHERAVRLQQAFLPQRIVEHPSVSVSATYRSATESLSVGGDWYDTFLWDDERLGVMVGDVAGHDIDAAVAMGQLRLSVAALATVNAADPGVLLDLLEHSAGSITPRTLATAAAVVFDPAARSLAYSRAGHPPPLLVTADGETTLLRDAKAPPVGYGLVDTHTTQTVPIPDRGLLLLYTDGLVERRGETFEEGLDRLRRTIGDLVRSGATEHLSELLVDRLCAGADHSDDVVAVVMRFLG